MIRQHLFDKRAPADPMFRWRGGDVSRIEGLSDCVFAFALTLIVVSLEVPQTVAELYAVLKTFPAFAICFIMLVSVWYHHYKFFRRFGLEDVTTIVMNTVLLFVVLFYVYPLKFVFSSLLNAIFDLEGPRMGDSTLLDGRILMTIYSVGVVLIFGMFALMHARGVRMREQLELDELEIYLSKTEIGSHLITAGIAVVSVLLAWFGGRQGPFYAGIIYFVMGPAQAFWGFKRGGRAEKMQRELFDA